jgi:hypothetical protein
MKVICKPQSTKVNFLHFALIPATVNHYLDFALDIFIGTLLKVPSTFQTMTKSLRIIYSCVLVIHGSSVALQSIDRLTLLCQEADDYPEVENAT